MRDDWIDARERTPDSPGYYRCDAAVAFAVRDEGGDRVGAWYASVGEDMPATVVARGLIRMEADEMVTAAISHEKAKAEWAKLKEEK